MTKSQSESKSSALDEKAESNSWKWFPNLSLNNILTKSPDPEVMSSVMDANDDASKPFPGKETEAVTVPKIDKPRESVFSFVSPGQSNLSCFSFSAEAQKSPFSFTNLSNSTSVAPFQSASAASIQISPPTFSSAFGSTNPPSFFQYPSDPPTVFNAFPTPPLPPILSGAPSSSQGVALDPSKPPMPTEAQLEQLLMIKMEDLYSRALVEIGKNPGRNPQESREALIQKGVPLGKLDPLSNLVKTAFDPNSQKSGLTRDHPLQSAQKLALTKMIDSVKSYRGSRETKLDAMCRLLICDLDTNKAARDKTKSPLELYAAVREIAKKSFPAAFTAPISTFSPPQDHRGRKDMEVRNYSDNDSDRAADDKADNKMKSRATTAQNSATNTHKASRARHVSGPIPVASSQFSSVTNSNSKRVGQAGTSPSNMATLEKSMGNLSIQDAAQRQKMKTGTVNAAGAGALPNSPLQATPNNIPVSGVYLRGPGIPSPVDSYAGFPAAGTSSNDPPKTITIGTLEVPQIPYPFHSQRFYPPATSAANSSSIPSVFGAPADSFDKSSFLVLSSKYEKLGLVHNELMDQWMKLEQKVMKMKDYVTLKESTLGKTVNGKVHRSDNSSFLMDTRDAVFELQKQNERLTEMLEISKNEIDNRKQWAEIRVAEVQETLRNKSNEVISMAALKDTLEKKLKECEHQNHVSQERVRELQRSVDEKQQDIVKLSNLLKSVENHVREANAEKEAANLRAMESESKLKENDESGKRDRKHIEKLEKQKKQMNEDMEGLKRKAETLTKELTTSREKERQSHVQCQKEQSLRLEQAKRADSEKKLRTDNEKQWTKKDEAWKKKLEAEAKKGADRAQELERDAARLKKSHESEVKKLRDKLAALEAELAGLKGLHEAEVKRSQERASALEQELQEQREAVRKMKQLDWLWGPKAEASEDKCCVCFAEGLGVLFVPCGHAVICEPCSDYLARKGANFCPSCKATVDLRTRLSGAIL